MIELLESSNKKLKDKLKMEEDKKIFKDTFESVFKEENQKMKKKIKLLEKYNND